MDLSFIDRLVITSIMPTKGSICEQLLAREILDKIKLNESEIKNSELVLNNSDGLIKWNPEKTHSMFLNVEFNDDEKNFLKDIVFNLDEKKLINSQNLDLCLKLKNL